MPASDAQVQAFADSRIRPLAERVRNLMVEIADTKAAIDDVYAALSTDPTWADDREDAPPHLLTPSDVLGINALITDLHATGTGHGQYPVLLKACVRAIQVQ